MAVRPWFNNPRRRGGGWSLSLSCREESVLRGWPPSCTGSGLASPSGLAPLLSSRMVSSGGTPGPRGLLYVLGGSPCTQVRLGIPKNLSSSPNLLRRSFRAADGKFLTRCGDITPLSAVRRRCNEATMAAWSDWPSVQHGVTAHFHMAEAGTAKASSCLVLLSLCSVGLCVGPGNSTHIDDLCARNPRTCCALSCSSAVGAGTL